MFPFQTFPFLSKESHGIQWRRLPLNFQKSIYGRQIELITIGNIPRLQKIKNHVILINHN